MLNTLAFILFFNLIFAQNFSDLNCTQCLEKSGKQCLSNDDFSIGTCCDPSQPLCQQKNNLYCVNSASPTSIKNSILRNWVCP